MIKLLLRKSSFAVVSIWFLCGLANASVLLDKAIVNAEKFESRGMPDYVSMDANEKFIEFSKPQVGPNEDLTIEIQNKYIFIKNKERIVEDVQKAIIEWGDGTTTDLNVNGAPATLSHRYASEGIFNIKVHVITPNNEYFEYAKAVSNTNPDIVASSGRVQPQKVIWREDCAGTIIEGKCYEIITHYKYEEPIEHWMKISGMKYISKPSLNISYFYNATYWRKNPANCNYTSIYRTKGVVTLEYAGPYGCVTKVRLNTVCLDPYYFSSADQKCKTSYTTKRLLEDGNVPASMYKPTNMEYK